jgi:hypothetical protein
MIYAQTAFDITNNVSRFNKERRKKYIENEIIKSAENGKYHVEIELGVCTNGIKINHESDLTIRRDDIDELEIVGYNIKYNKYIAIISWSK